MGVAGIYTKPPLQWDQPCLVSGSLFSTLTGQKSKLLIKPPWTLQSTHSLVAFLQTKSFFKPVSHLFKHKWTALAKKNQYYHVWSTYLSSCSLQWGLCSALHSFMKPWSPISLHLMSNTHSWEVPEVRTDARSSQLASVSLHTWRLCKSNHIKGPYYLNSVISNLKRMLQDNLTSISAACSSSVLRTGF